MTEMVDLDNLTTKQVYAILGHVCKFEIGDRVRYVRGQHRTPVECEIDAISVQYGKVIYDNTADQWGYEDQYTAIPASDEPTPNNFTDEDVPTSNLSRV